MADIFISYNNANRQHAETFAALLEGCGFSVWWDDRIKPERSWDEVVEEEISAARSVVVLWTPQSVESRWVRLEAYYAHTHGKLVPVMIERCAVPLAFQLTQLIDLTDWDGDRASRSWVKLLSWIGDLKAAPAGPSAEAASAAAGRAVVGELPSGEPVFDAIFVTALTPSGTLFQDGDGAPVMRIVPAGDFLLGGVPEDAETTSVEMPQKHIHIARPFAMSVYPVTWGQYDRFAAARLAPAVQSAPRRGWFAKREPPPEPAAIRGAPAHPMNQVTFDEAVAFAAALSRSASAVYRLPSEAEWEYACRAGSRSRYWWGDEIDASRALYRSEGARHSGSGAPGAYPPNLFGLYDMHGNVREWTEDIWHESYDLVSPDGRSVTHGHGAMRVTRGGGWSDPASMLRSSARGRATQSIRSDVIGFRIVRSL
ncbi:MAG TPA: SUMF1/EgtB/PvdO family nonheme iron enzyme [Rhizomicrobium sp.]|jgi:formylglycine-generating enzyme required for sulfatase activity|nr:SUMF1/EgtB/PvdO family nonheme iron enzyme [Rhizomicrobium sp.]